MAKSYSMKLLQLICGMSLCLLFGSCYKKFELKLPETADSTAGNAGVTTGTLLKMESTGSKGTTTTSYEYDTNGRVTKIKTTNAETDGGTQVRHYVRDSIGRVIKVVGNIKWSSAGNGSTLNGNDSAVINVHYPSATSAQFDYTTFSYTLQGVTTADSSAYMYTNGRVTEMNSYVSLGGVMNVPTLKITYSYDTNGNVTQLKAYAPDPSGSGNMSLMFTFTMTVDDKTTPLQMGNDALIEGGDGLYTGKNNTTRIAADANPILTSYPSQVSTITYQYNAANRPVTAQYVNLVQGNKSIKFYYK